MNEKIAGIILQIDGLTVRERVILFGAVTAVVVGLWNFLLFSSVVDERKSIAAEITAIQNNISEQQTSQDILLAELSVDPDKAAKQEKKILEDKMNDISQNISRLSKSLIPPEALPMVLEDLLAKNTTLSLVSLKMSPVQPLQSTTVVETKTPDDSAASVARDDLNASEPSGTLYKHGVVVTLEGEFFKTLEYLQKIEALEWQLYWENFSYEVLSYPMARVSVEVYTLSAVGIDVDA